MWGETADTSNVQQTIWPRAAAAAGMLYAFSESYATLNPSISVYLTSLLSY